ncbi:hypothetical protein K2X92_04295 [Candidatus Gracilibacteria bacterium]|nr:hypothetical protein [Candidatus Gracilibacteria bacterium]
MNTLKDKPTSEPTPKDKPTSEPTPEEKTARIRARFAAIAQARGLISSEKVVAEVPKQVLDIVIGDEGAVSTGDNGSVSQIMEEVPLAITKITETMVAVERNNLQKGRSVITMTGPDGEVTTYKYVGKSSYIDNLYAKKKRFLKLELIAVLGGDDAEIGRIDAWNGIISPINQVRYAKGREGGYGEKLINFSNIEVKY